ncbi:hypothetical protein [Streptomyces mirabilis]
MEAVDCIIRYYFDGQPQGRLDDDATGLLAEWRTGHQRERGV